MEKCSCMCGVKGGCRVSLLELFPGLAYKRVMKLLMTAPQDFYEAAAVMRLFFADCCRSAARGLLPMCSNAFNVHKAPPSMHFLFRHVPVVDVQLAMVAAHSHWTPARR